MSMKKKIFNVLVSRGEQRTAAQLAAQLRTTPSTVAARVSELRDEGYTIYAERRTDTKGRVKVFYRRGNPTLEMVAAGRAALKAFGISTF